MGRRRFRFAVGASGVLALVVAVAWVRGFWVMDAFFLSRYHWPDADRAKGWSVDAYVDCDGILCKLTLWDCPVASEAPDRARKLREAFPPGTHFSYGGTLPSHPDTVARLPFFHHEVYTESQRAAKRSSATERWWGLMPFWLLQAVTLALPGVAAVNRVRRGRRRRRAGRCPECGYDLRASSGRCPECGAPARPHESAADVVTGSRSEERS